MEQQMILIAIKGSHHEQIFGPCIVQVAQWKKKLLSKEIQWKNWIFQVRTIPGYKAVPILQKKSKLITPKKHIITTPYFD